MATLVNKQDIASTVSQELGIPKARVESVMESVADAIKESVKAGNNVTWYGLVNFSVKTRAAKSGVVVGKKYTTKAKQVVSVKATKSLQDAAEGV